MYWWSADVSFDREWLQPNSISRIQLVQCTTAGPPGTSSDLIRFLEGCLFYWLFCTVGPTELENLGLMWLSFLWAQETPRQGPCPITFQHFYTVIDQSLKGTSVGNTKVTDLAFVVDAVILLNRWGFWWWLLNYSLRRPWHCGFRSVRRPKCMCLKTCWVKQSLFMCVAKILIPWKFHIP